MKNNIRFLICALTAVLLLCGCGRREEPYFASEDPSAGFSVKETSSAAAESAADSDRSDGPCIYVYICGEVKKPGVFELPEESRVFEAVEKAGGFTKEAKKDAVNLAEVLTDGQMVVIPAQADPAAVSEATSASGIAPDGRVNINTATLEELMTLTGIGESKARMIIDYRTENGAFQKPDDLMKIAGIKEGTFEKIRDRIIV